MYDLQQCRRAKCDATKTFAILRLLAVESVLLPKMQFKQSSPITMAAVNILTQHQVLAEERSIRKLSILSILFGF